MHSKEDLMSEPRRDFIKGTVATAAVAALASTTPRVWAAGSDAPEKKEVKIGFIPLTDCASVVLAPLPSPRPPKKAARTVFDTGSVWRLEETHAGHLLTLRSPVYGHNPYLAVEFDRNYVLGHGETVDGGRGFSWQIL